MTAPKVKVEVGYGSTWQTEPHAIVWTDESCNVLQADHVVTQRGATAARGETVAGTCGLSLKNKDRRFDPTYADGPLFGMLKPGTPVRITGVPRSDDGYIDGYDDHYTGYTLKAPVWYGTIPAWPQRYDLSNRWAWVPIEAYDGVDKLSRAKIPRSVLEVEVLKDNPIGFWLLNEKAGTQMVDSSGHRRDGAYSPNATEAAATRGPVDGIKFDGTVRGVVEDTAAVLAVRPGVIEAVIAPDNNLDQPYGYVVAAGLGLTSSYSTLRVHYEAGHWTADGWILDGSASTRCITNPLDYDGNPHHIAIRVPAATAAQTYVDGVNNVESIQTVLVSEPFRSGLWIGDFLFSTSGGELPYRGFASAVAIYDTDIGAGRIAAHARAAIAPLAGQRTDQRIKWILDQLDWPIGLRAFQEGRTLLGAATFKPGDLAWDYLKLVNASEDGRLFLGPDGVLTFLDRYWPFLDARATTSQFTFSDGALTATWEGQEATWEGEPIEWPGQTGYSEFELDLDDELLVNVASFTRRDGSVQTARNEASITEHGEAVKEQSDLLQRTDNEVLSLAQWTVASQGTTLPRVPQIRIPLHAYSDEEQIRILRLDLGYRVSVIRTPQGVGDPIELDFLIDGIQHDTGEGEWWTTFYVSPVPQDTVTLFILDQSELDGSDVLAY